MKRLLILLVLGVMIQSDVKAQLTTTSEIRDYLVKYKWMLRRFEQDDKYFTVPKDEQGKKMVFLANGQMYYYMPGESESSAPRYNYTLTKDRLVLTRSGESKKTFSFEIKDFIGYKIYTVELDGYSNPTYVWEESGKNETVSTTTPSTSGSTTVPLGSSTGGSSSMPMGATAKIEYPENASVSQWYMAFSKGVKFGQQSWLKRPEFPFKEIEEKWKEGYYIIDVAYGGYEDKWFVSMAKTGYTNQTWQARKTRDEIADAINACWKENPKYSVTNLVYANGLWIMVASEGSKYDKQSFIRGETDFPVTKIKEFWGNDYDVTDMVYGAGGWIVMMSTGLSFSDQKTREYDKWDHKNAFDERKDGYVLSSVAKTRTKYYALYTKDLTITKSEYKVDRSLPSGSVKKYWDDGFDLYKTIYIPPAY